MKQDKDKELAVTSMSLSTLLLTRTQISKEVKIENLVVLDPTFIKVWEVFKSCTLHWHLPPYPQLFSMWWERTWYSGTQGQCDIKLPQFTFSPDDEHLGGLCFDCPGWSCTQAHGFIASHASTTPRRCFKSYCEENKMIEELQRVSESKS